MKTIAVKYCGGCNPYFDRVELVSKLLSGVAKLEPVSLNGSAADFALTVSGCSRQCASTVDIQNISGKFDISSPDEYALIGGKIKIELEKYL